MDEITVSKLEASLIEIIDIAWRYAVDLTLKTTKSVDKLVLLEFSIRTLATDRLLFNLMLIKIAIQYVHIFDRIGGSSVFGVFRVRMDSAADLANLSKQAGSYNLSFESTSLAHAPGYYQGSCSRSFRAV